jgi:hypothetical protein
MNKSELVERVAAATDLEKREAVVANTRAGNNVALFGSGTFVPTSHRGFERCEVLASYIREEDGQVGQVHQEALAKGGTE